MPNEKPDEKLEDAIPDEKPEDKHRLLGPHRAHLRQNLPLLDAFSSSPQAPFCQEKATNSTSDS